MLLTPQIIIITADSAAAVQIKDWELLDISLKENLLKEADLFYDESGFEPECYEDALAYVEQIHIPQITEVNYVPNV